MRRRIAARLSAVVLAACAAIVPLALDEQAAHASIGSPAFLPEEHYTGEFSGPSVIVVNNTYWAFATNTGGLQLPVMHSANLKTWTTRSAYPDEPPYNSLPGYFKRYNDAMPVGYAAKWAPSSSRASGRSHVASWEPSVAAVGGRFVEAYAVPLPNRRSSQRHCISIATSAHVDGPYKDTSTAPIVCSGDPAGSIDPQVFLDNNGTPYLIWKNAGVKGSKPTQIFIRQLDATGTAFAAGSHQHFLLQTSSEKWEGNLIESPAMISYDGRYYLFYSANLYDTAHYATGYAVCKTALGPCRRIVRTPLLHANRTISGPGAATPFIDLQGKLRLAYSAWRPGHVGYPTSDNAPCVAKGTCNQKRLHIATLAVGKGGRLSVRAFG